MSDPREAFRAAILAQLGYAPESIEPGRLQRFPTCDRRGDSAGWCMLFADLRGGLFGCFRQGVRETWRNGDHKAGTRKERLHLARQVMAGTAERLRVQRTERAEFARRNADLWAQCVPAEPGDPVMRYLAHRGCGDLWPVPDVLRLHPALPYWHNNEKIGTFPALIAPLVAPGGSMVALHRTYLTEDGRKADVPTPKKLTRASGPVGGACIPLYVPVRGVVGIAEGIETALAAHCASGVPMVASYCADNMATWQWPAGTQRLIIFADADPAGHRAAETLRQRAAAARIHCEVLRPSSPDADWCDVWAQRDDPSREVGGTE